MLLCYFESYLYKCSALEVNDIVQLSPQRDRYSLSLLYFSSIISLCRKDQSGSSLRHIIRSDQLESPKKAIQENRFTGSQRNEQQQFSAAQTIFYTSPMSTMKSSATSRPCCSHPPSQTLTNVISSRGAVSLVGPRHSIIRRKVSGIARTLESGRRRCVSFGRR